MAAPASADEFFDLVKKSGVVEEKRLDTYAQQLRAGGSMPEEPGKLAGYMVRDGLLTHFQAEQFLLGKWRRFTIGKYKVLERLGSGGMGSVYLCEHKFMRRRVAVKVLPAAKAEDPSSLERFYREARAAAALDHPNIVRAYDIDQDENLHFLVMEYVDGASLQEIIKKTGPMHVLRAAHYIRQAAIGLQHAHEAGLVHRDIKPGNILVDRAGTVKVLDMGLARFFHDEEDILTKKYDESVLGTADYLAPEQALDSHGVDIRADIYSLGATFYFCLTGQPPFNEGTVAQKLIWHQTRQPKPIRTVRPEVPEQLAVIIDRMMTKDKAKRYQTPAQVAEVLGPLTTRPIPPPPETEMPRLSPAAMGSSQSESGTNPATPAPSPPMRPTTPTTTPAVRVAPQQVAALAPPVPRSQANQPTPDPRRVATPPPRQPSTPAFRPPTPMNGAPPVAIRPDEPAPNWGELAPGRPAGAPRSSTRRIPPVPPLQKYLAKVKLRPRFWAILGGGILLVLIVLIVLLKWTLGGKNNKTTPSSPSSPSRRLNVSRNGEFHSIREALAKAVPGDHIVVRDEIHEEKLELRSLKDVTIEADPGLGKRVTWRPPAASRENPALNQLLTISNCDGLTLKGFLLSGQNDTVQAQDIITLFSHSPGLKLEDIHLQKFNRSAVNLINANGESGRPILLSGLRAAPPLKPDGVALLVEVRKKFNPPAMDHVVIENCRLDGPCKAAILLAVDTECKTASLELRGNRLFGNQTGAGVLLAQNPKGRGPLQLTLADNTFFNFPVGLHMESLPALDDKQLSRLTLRNNLFVGVSQLAQFNDLPIPQSEQGPKDPRANWVWFNEGSPERNAPSGDVFFRSPPFNVPPNSANAILDITADDLFVVYVNGQEVGRGSDIHRVFAFDVTARLRPNENVIAVQATNKTGPAGLIVRLSTGNTGNPSRKPLAWTSAPWKAVKDNAPAGWQEPQFKENEQWRPVKNIVPYGKGFHKNLTWDSVVADKRNALLAKLIPPETGSVRDGNSQEGNVPLRSRVLEIKDLNRDPASEQFLRYPKNSPLATAGLDKKPVGAPPLE